MGVGKEEGVWVCAGSCQISDKLRQKKKGRGLPVLHMVKGDSSHLCMAHRENDSFLLQRRDFF